MSEILFPFAEYWQFYAGFSGFVLLLLLLDLGVFHRRPHAVSMREAALWSVIWISLALCFNYFFYRYALVKFGQIELARGAGEFVAEVHASRVALEFLTGFIVEKALAIDNIFVFVVVFSFFAIPAELQHRVLFFGIIGALIFRAAFIALGSALMQHAWIVWLFGLFLLVTGIKIMLAPKQVASPGDNWMIKLCRRYLPLTDRLHGQKFFVRENGKRLATPLFLALLFVELSDIIFAVDSVPAIFAITREPLIVFTSNIFAILGLRSMYFLLAGVVDRFHLLKYGLGAVLVFVGLKMIWLNDAFGGKFPVTWSLAIISTLIGGSVLLSLLRPATNSVPDVQK